MKESKAATAEAAQLPQRSAAQELIQRALPAPTVERVRPSLVWLA